MLRRSPCSFFSFSPFLLQSSSSSSTSSDNNLYPRVTYCSEAVARERIANLPSPIDMAAAFYVEGNSVDSLADVKAAGCTQVLLVGHGLLGSARNWNGTSRKIG